MGTNVRLDTPEDVEAWIAERKRRWPSTARIAEKKRKLEEAIASGGAGLQFHHPDRLMLARNKRPRPPFRDAEVTRTNRGGGRGSFGGGRGGRGRGRGAGGGRNRGHDEGPRAVTSTQTQPSPVVTTTMTERRSCVSPARDDASHLDPDSGSDNDAPQVLSAKRPPGIEEYKSSSDAEPEQPLDRHLLTPTIPPLGAPSTAGASATAAAAQPPTVVKEQSAKYHRRAPPPQPKKPPRNPFAARSSLLRNVSEPIYCLSCPC
jgi:Nuclear fragile X mental retardation-interacting protein 1 (NUFIP1)